MALELNEPRKVYKEFYGRNIDKMPELIEQGFSPLSMAQVMQRRLDVLGSTPEVKDAWWMNYFDTGDGIAYDRSGNIKIEYDSPTMRSLNPESKLKSGALVLADDDAFEKIQGPEFTSKDIAKYKFNESLRESDVNEHPFWMALARGDKVLLKEYAHQVFKKAKETQGYDKNMGVYLSSFREVPNMRLWLLGRLNNNGSGNGNYNVDYNDGRLVGVAPEAHGAEKIVTPSLEQVMKASLKYIAPVNAESLRKELSPLYKN
ncbi:MAG: hypothetical protein KJ583_07725 [Nanoarchaeota archaeon]|nr:hypothetical protein [Nanoarchaeota archaeon]MBU1270282.1 hypothetical protein [Nanoarchaeota archaeon]MBU1605175.1 hypothetical protein [Nanoarchaeota archaeon]MBU2442533.1 hypothetical protein [Nanoarchaeota archaeon]